MCVALNLRKHVIHTCNFTKHDHYPHHHRPSSSPIITHHHKSSQVITSHHKSSIHYQSSTHHQSSPSVTTPPSIITIVPIVLCACIASASSSRCSGIMMLHCLPYTLGPLKPRTTPAPPPPGCPGRSALPFSPCTTGWSVRQDLLTCRSATADHRPVCRP